MDSVRTWLLFQDIRPETQPPSVQEKSLSSVLHNIFISDFLRDNYTSIFIFRDDIILTSKSIKHSLVVARYFQETEISVAGN